MAHVLDSFKHRVLDRIGLHGYPFKGCDFYNSIVQGTWVANLDATQIYALYFQNAPPAQNDEINYKLFHKAGTYTLVLLHMAGNNRAIATVIIDGVVQGTIDTYNAAAAVHNVYSTLPVTFLTDGEHTINFKAATRNGASTNWYLGLTAFSFRD